MSSVRIGLILVVIGCAEPTANYKGAETPVIQERPQRNSYSINSVNRTVSVLFTRVRNEGDEPIHAFMRRMFESADSAGARRLVLDLRSVSGSDTFLLVPLLKGVIARERFLGRGGLFVIVGRDSFSPLQNVATLLRQYANPVFASAPTGLGSAR